ncbi:hypothetical protein Hneap_0968 [Halothiobacillus neapolitanus c2]|uniref:Uncharacterized protein n=1 Tax=Halothiobacillus neapolitanus (strain ATCC 23641 / DSM 15147 / CIP 104769 / NCIMB 8539 / c2) TaxID=555778 RepID=D0KZD3_HALNC|nr:hypothetical protein Hneap_0968 [Halothiobacillus neapolitanus c2]TDN66116.1 hypothetical protein C8D83_101437 [Halothiobacillus neapolitanus]
MGISERSLKAKEKFADGNMAVANSITSAVFISVLVFPLSVFVSAIALGKEPFDVAKVPPWGEIWLFAGLYFSPLLVAWYAKKTAMDLYDEIDKATHNNSIKWNHKKLRYSRFTHAQELRRK